MRQRTAVLVLAILCAGAGPLRAEDAGVAQRRQALRTDVRNLLAVVPELDALAIPSLDQQRLGQDGLAQLKTAYTSKRDELSSLEAELGKPMTEDRIEEAQTGFPQQKSDMLSLLFSATSSHYGDDPDRFMARMQELLDIHVAEQKKLQARGMTQKELAAIEARINRYNRRLGPLADEASIDRIYDAVGARPVAAAVPVAYVGSGAAPLAAAQAAFSGVRVSEFKPSVNVQPAAAPPAPAAQTASDGGVLSYLDQSKAAQLARYVRDRARGFAGKCLQAVGDAMIAVGVMTEDMYQRLMPLRRGSHGATHYAADMAPALNQFLNSNDGPSSQVRLRRISTPDLQSWFARGTLPLGATIIYGPGVCGFSRTAGHIEVVTSQNPLRATSDGVEGVDLDCIRAEEPIGRVNIYVPAKIGSGS